VRESAERAIVLDNAETALGTPYGEIPAIFEHEPNVDGDLWPIVSGADDEARRVGARNEGLAVVGEVFAYVRAAFRRYCISPDRCVLKEYLDEVSCRADIDSFADEIWPILSLMDTVA